MSTSQAAPSMGSAIGAAISLTIFTSFLGEGVTIVGEVLHTQGMQENAPIRQADW
jgi:DHA2 family multidrug resistance protein-like MFS transporter